MDIKRFNLSVSGSFTDGQVIIDSTLIDGFFGAGRPTRRVTVQSIVLLDKDAQAQPVDILLLRQDATVGTSGQAVSINDVNANRIFGVIQITNYVDLVNSSIAQSTNLGIPLESLAVSNDLYIALICRGTATYSDGFTLKLGVEE